MYLSVRNTRASSNEDFFIPWVKTCQADIYINSTIMVLKTELFVPSHIKCTNGEKFFKTKVKSLILQKGINLKQNSDMLYY